MKKFFRIPLILVIVSLLFAACAPTGEQPAEFILPPDSPEAQAAQQAGGSNVVSVDTRPTIQAQYDACLADIDLNITESWIPTNEFGEMAGQVWYCGGSQAALAGGMVLVPAQKLANLTPTKADEAVLYGIVLIKNVGYFAILMGASYLVGDAIAYTVADQQAIAWTNGLTATTEENVFWSTRHAESPEVIAGAFAYAYNGYLRQQGPGNNSGSIQMWAGVDMETMTARVAIVMIVGTQVNYAAIRGDVLHWGANIVPGTYLNLGNGLAMDTSKATWTAAWRMSKTIGHEAKPQSDYLTVGQGLIAWKFIQQKYSLYIPVVEIILPPSPF